jgi:hypothetical protein
MKCSPRLETFLHGAIFSKRFTARREVQRSMADPGMKEPDRNNTRWKRQRLRVPRRCRRQIPGLPNQELTESSKDCSLRNSPSILPPCPLSWPCGGQIHTKAVRVKSWKVYRPIILQGMPQPIATPHRIQPSASTPTCDRPETTLSYSPKLPAMARFPVTAARSSNALNTSPCEREAVPSPWPRQVDLSNDLKKESASYPIR